MSRKKPRRTSRRRFAPSRRARVAIAVVLVTSVFAAWTMLAYSGAPHSAFRHNYIKAITMAPPSLNPGSPSKEYIYAGGRLLATEEPAGCGGAPSAPSDLLATANTATSVHLVWTAPAGADHYEIERSSDFGAPNNGFAFVASVVGTSHQDTNLSINTAYVYRVRAFDSAGCPSDYSNVDLATTTVFPETVAFGVPIRASHINELFTAVNAVRVTAGLEEFNWPTPPAVGGPIKKDHVQLLRNNLNPARSGLGLPPQSYTNNPLNVGNIVLAAHIQELRNGVK